VSEQRSKAPFVVFGGILAIALTSVLAVLIYDCQRDEPYLEPEAIEPGSPDRVPPPPPEPR
jgi:hypothetical protein